MNITELRALLAAATPGEWVTGETPRYLSAGQAADGEKRLVNPITIRSPEHTEEIATVWTYLLPTEANAALIAALHNDAPALLDVVEAAKAMEADLIDRAKWMHFQPSEDGKRVPCGAGVWVKLTEALAALETDDEG